MSQISVNHYVPLQDDTKSLHSTDFLGSSLSQTNMLDKSLNAQNQADLDSYFREIESVIKTGGYICYKYTIVVLTILSLVGLMVNFFSISSQMEIHMIPHLVYLLLNFWQVYQFFIAFQAVQRRDLAKAEKVVRLIGWFMGIFFTINIVFLVAIRYNEFSFAGIAESFDLETDNLHGIIVLLIFLFLLLEMVIYALILYGALKVRDLFKETWESISQKDEAKNL